ncbi:Gfo/Idh/MocA family protein [Phreatobacter sp. AB_2022a]|uniref:Gfo/Idh/MocA family protein n=1 Tax=Phreatobacter sp. AB_2022a TaxID=3003134 RepID=UPI0022872101|nr:Gfo/Idh/MocA family oxidoreductase [Phreatobacter sp. AB_2022a]MCZ0738346.1 Gfo/Idh/MocA family oxidoreductase [Phreatobacter sp. AB_2022a]
MMRFAVIGIDHRHIYHMLGGLIEAGATCAGFDPETSDPRVLAGLRERFPGLPEAGRRALLEDPSVDIVLTAAIPAERADIAIAAMRHGKDVMADKPGITSAAQLEAVRRAVAETGRIFSICFSERFIVPATTVAERLIREGAIGRVVQTLGLGPHRLNRAIRPAWFFDTAHYGGILVDIASHQIDQFLTFTGSADATIAASAIGHFGLDDLPDFQDFGEVLLRSDTATGYIRVDWFTADGLPTWGDGRLTILGTEGTIELRKYVDIAGRPGTDHVFLVDAKGVRHIDASNEPVTYFRRFLADCRDRTETAMRQAHVFTVCRLALDAQAKAALIGGMRPEGPR